MNYTREQAEEVWNDWCCFDDGTFSDFLNAKFPTIEVGKWYKSERGALIRATSEALEDGYIFAGFGINTLGEWDFCERWITESFTPATDQEVLDRLTEEAKKRYKLGDSVRSVCTKQILEVNRKSAEIDDDYFWFSGIAVLNLSNGEWANVIESATNSHSVDALRYALDYGKAVSQASTEVVYHIGDEEVKPTSIQDKIEALERELAELKQLINK
jgi:hypothetical protein